MVRFCKDFHNKFGKKIITFRQQVGELPPELIGSKLSQSCFFEIKNPAANM